MTARRFLIIVCGFWVAFVFFAWRAVADSSSNRPLAIIAAVCFCVLACGGVYAYPKFRRQMERD